MYRNIYKNQKYNWHFFGYCTFETLEKAVEIGRKKSRVNSYVKTVRLDPELYYNIYVERRCRTEIIHYV